MNNWFARVKSGAMSCGFNNTLEENVRNKFLTGLRKGPVLDKMCEESLEKTTQELVQIAVAKEIALAEREVDIS